MGPIALFDKSFLQSLSLDESVWFDHFYFPVISPLFFVETLADLEKAVRQGRTPEQEVGYIADKTPEMHGGPCIHHSVLCLADLQGFTVPMNGRIPVSGGRLLRADGKLGVEYEVTPEVQAMSRWREGRFLEVERDFAQQWRASLNEVDPLATMSAITTMGGKVEDCKSLERTKAMADELVRLKGTPAHQMQLAFLILRIPRNFQDPILARWKETGSPPLHQYAPYAAHVVTVDIFFQMALTSGLISPDRPSNRIDIAYLFYLPFCMVFASSDKLHRRCAPLFLRSDQDFVWGQDLKADLQRINELYLALSESERERGINAFAPVPPESGGYLTTQLWDRYLPSWRGRQNQSHRKRFDNEKEEVNSLVESASKLAKAAPLEPTEVGFHPADIELMTINRMVRKRKGTWWQVPSDL
jgi:hypothetical protein